jgi:cell division protein ZapA
MGQVVVKINSRDFSLNCDDGQEPRIRRLAQYVDSKVAEFVKTNGQVGEARLILLAAILLADELSDANEALQRERAAKTDIKGDAPDTTAGAASSIRDIAQRIESIAAGRETP